MILRLTIILYAVLMHSASADSLADSEVFKKTIMCITEREKGSDANIELCIDATNLIEQQSYISSLLKSDKAKKLESSALPELYLNAGIIASNQGNYGAAYRYYKSAVSKESSSDNHEAIDSARYNIKILCENYPHICK
jgi:hypothetical protein